MRMPSLEGSDPEHSNLNSHIAEPAASGSGIFIECLPDVAHHSTKEKACGNRKLRVLIVEDNDSDVELALRSLRRDGFAPEYDVVKTAADFTSQVRNHSYEVVLADYSVPGWNGMESVQILRQVGLDIPVIVVSGALGDLRAVECIKQGAADYVLKDHLPRLPASVRRALREKKLRDELRRDQAELARSNRDLEQFAYAASHDLQEPLRMVATYAQLLEERYRGKLDENADKYIHYAVDGALRMQTLVQDLLAFSRVGRMGHEPKAVDCKLAVQSAIANLQAAIQETGARVIVQDLPTITADRPELVQLFQNLIGNAIKFRRTAAPEVRVAVELQGANYAFSVTDNGIGIAPEHVELIFGIFKRLHTHTEYPGSGIGLAICKKIVEQNGGRIWVESQPGQGSTFRFTWPVKKEERRSYDHAHQSRG